MSTASTAVLPSGILFREHPRENSRAQKNAKRAPEWISCALRFSDVRLILEFPGLNPDSGAHLEASTRFIQEAGSFAEDPDFLEESGAGPSLGRLARLHPGERSELLDLLQVFHLFEGHHTHDRVSDDAG